MRKKADERSLYYAGYFWYIAGRGDKAKEYIDRGLKQNDQFNEVSGKPVDSKQVMRLVDGHFSRICA